MDVSPPIPGYGERAREAPRSGRRAPRGWSPRGPAPCKGKPGYGSGVPGTEEQHLAFSRGPRTEGPVALRVSEGADMLRFHPVSISLRSARDREHTEGDATVLDGHWPAGAVNRLLGCAALSPDSGVQGFPFQSMAESGGASVSPSHHTVLSGHNATFVNRVFARQESNAFGLVSMLVPGATPKNPASGLMA